MSGDLPHENPTLTRDDWLAGGLLTAGVLLTFWPVLDCGFINYRDPDLVAADRLRAGLSWPGLSWALTGAYADALARSDDASIAAWQPLVWLSLLLDHELYGFRAWGYHLTNLLWHLGSTLVLFAALRRMTGRTWASFIAAALFAAHPLSLQPVAFVGARKEVIGAFFWMLTLLTYVYYAEQPSRGRYLVVAASLTVGLQADQALLTLPCVLLLLDYWPLGRWSSGAARLIVEKLPLLALAVGMALLVLAGQRYWAPRTLYVPPAFGTRLDNALLSYAAYLSQVLLPIHLALHYPFAVAGVPLWQSLGAAVLLSAVTVVTLVQMRRRPYLAVGWLWYVVALLPVSGLLLQVSRDARADRYAYVPLVGIYVAAAWGLVEFCRRGRTSHLVGSVCAGMWLLACMVVSKRDIEPWHSSRQAWEHALRVTNPDVVTHHYLAAALRDTDRLGARHHFEVALRLEPAFAPTLDALVPMLIDLGEFEAAEEYCRAALGVRLDSAAAHRGLGLVFVKQHDLVQAATHLRRALRLGARDAATRVHLGWALLEQGELDEARRHLEAAAELEPSNVDALYHLGLVCLRSGERDRAAAHFRAVLRLRPRDELAHFNLGIALKDQASQQEAIDHLRRALELSPQLAGAHYHLGLIYFNRGELKPAETHLQAAVRLLPRAAPGHVALGKLRLEQGDAAEARRCFEKGAGLDPDNPELRELLQKTGPS